MSGTREEFNLSVYLEKWRGKVDYVLDKVLPPAGKRPAALHEAMRYSVFAGGKRIRPILSVAAIEALNGNGENVLRVGAAIEMVHAYSLIHDDLPAMDNDDLRRGKPTCHKKFGEAAAILAGDALLTDAFGIIVTDQNLDPWIKNVFIAELVLAAGSSGMVGGQVVDMEMEKQKYDKIDLDFIHENKTAKMIALSVVAGAMIGNADEKELDAMRGYGKSLGLCFQIVDDVLNVAGGKETGKGVGTDAERGKATYPALIGLDKSRERARALRDEALECLCVFDDRAEALREIARYVVARDR